MKIKKSLKVIGQKLFVVAVFFGIYKQKCICGNKLIEWGRRLDCDRCYRKYY